MNSNSDLTFRTLAVQPGEGSGVHSSLGAHAALNNTTVSGNVGDGLTATTGGLLSTWFNTITNNSRNGATAVPVGPGVPEAGLVFITASILAGNGGNDCNGDMVTSGYNLIGDDTNCVLGPVANDNDIIGTSQTPVDPLLGPLQYNGGANETHAIDESSPAFNAAGPDLTGLPCHDFATDQRGITRPKGPACDIGAFEVDVPVGPLQSLIDAAVTGATIIIPDGTYNEQISIGDGKTLQATTPFGVTIDATGYGGSAITATGGDFTLNGIHVTGGSSDSNGGGIIANVAGTNINLIDVIFDYNSATLDGGAIYLLNGTLSASNATFSNNSAGGNGGAILGGTASTINISATQFDNNSAASSGGTIFNEGILTIINSTVTASSAGSGGGVFNSGAALLNITGSTFSNNAANNPA